VGDFASMGSNGSSLSTGLDVSYPLLRSQPTNINLMANYEQKRFDNNNLSGSVSHYNIDVYSIGVNANQLDNWNGGGMSNASATLTTGQVNLDGSANQSTDTNGPATAGNFAKLSLSLSRLQKLDTTLSAYVAVNMQMANKNLDSSERMYLGGASGVRAYPSSEGGGSQGNTFTAELRQQLNSHYTVTGFYDRGHVQAFKNNAYADGTAHLNSGSFSNNYSLSGYGVSLAWQSLKGTELRATLAHRKGRNPLADNKDNDQDGTRKFNRLWLNASVNF
jgi:hemolysin activation/secretion protein